MNALTDGASDLLGPRLLAGLLRDSVVLRCAQWCQMQRTPRGK